MGLIRSSAALVMAIAIVAVLPAADPARFGPAAHASTLVTASGGNCDYWYPFGDSWTTWNGYPSTAWGGVTGDLTWNGYLMVSGSASGSGGSGSAVVNNPYPYYEYGTGWWVEYGAHTGSMISGPVRSNKWEWCG